ncbi:ATP-binding protein [Streptomyces griseocarneus]|uniref:ATP-binding protein n=1 Tax=Streptomyces griseocarneus TaxID=51201 RepID=UPI00167F11FF|nr:ATP-binding protein [Streptomyces griseocarneus]MBZ6472816.1 ATP-binding protein [Streptomyces griseocarneus]GHG47487.1 ATP-binding protein [Streptomyces griseocarneus]
METLGSVPPEPGHAPGPRKSAEYDGTWRYTAPALDSTVPRARHAVRDLMRRQRVPLREDLLQGLLLIVSELVTNAVQHAALLSPEVGLEVSLGPEWVRVAVEDSHPYRPRPLEAYPDDEPRTGGRGLLLVQATVEEAGGRCDVEHTATGGKVVWAALPLRPSPTSPLRPR